MASLLPKRNYCYLKGIPSYDDSLVALYKRFDTGAYEKIIWSVYDLSHSRPFEMRKGTEFVRNGSLKDLWYGMVSKTMFTTHGHFLKAVPRGQVCVNVWHGMPFKAIGLLAGEEGKDSSYFCSTSPLFRDVLARSFGVREECGWMSGIPRNDFLFESKEGIWEAMGLEREKYKKVFFWLPTYRTSTMGNLIEDGVEAGNVFNMVGFPSTAFARFLEKEKCLCIIKPHPLAPRNEEEFPENIMVIDEEWMWQRGVLLYQILSEVDFLVSDISSVMVDFALLDRPMFVCFEDSEEYKAKRKMVFEPIEDWLPGEIVHGYEGLREAISSCVAGEDSSQEKRRKLCKQFHSYQDGRSTERVLEELG
ncbi:CDP-glycerol glycerophosphotransferase family protein [Rubritalea spongiae]|uniref:CDP-glycerol glycerophosphotransferase family protein n=1 Tax=Rubritalea spongiae TaxID=430797 RepID=UPI0036720B6A